MKDFVVKYPSLFLVARSTYVLSHDLNLTGLEDLKSMKFKYQYFSFVYIYLLRKNTNLSNEASTILITISSIQDVIAEVLCQDMIQS